jgi:hypothetical protein
VLAMMKMSEAWWYAGLITGQVLTHLTGPYFGLQQKSLPLVAIGLVVGLGLGALFDKLARGAPRAPGGPDAGPF